MTWERQGLAKQSTLQTTPQKLIHRNKEISKMQNKRAIGYVRKQEQLLKKFEDTEQFFETVRQNKSFKRNNNVNS